jgi:hypothetical protein
MDADEWDDCYLSMEDGLWLATLAGQGERYRVASGVLREAAAQGDQGLMLHALRVMGECLHLEDEDAAC